MSLLLEEAACEEQCCEVLDMPESFIKERREHGIGEGRSVWEGQHLARFLLLKCLNSGLTLSL